MKAVAIVKATQKNFLGDQGALKLNTGYMHTDHGFLYGICLL